MAADEVDCDINIIILFDFKSDRVIDCLKLLILFSK